MPLQPAQTSLEPIADAVSDFCRKCSRKRHSDLFDRRWRLCKQLIKDRGDESRTNACLSGGLGRRRREGAVGDELAAVSGRLSAPYVFELYPSWVEALS